MAVVRNNLFTQGLSGTVGGELTFKQLYNRTVATRKRGPNKKPTSAGVQVGRDRFQAAVAWYWQVVQPNRNLIAAYVAARKKPSHTAYNAAISDFMTGPEITGVDISGYRGWAGGVIRVEATDNFWVAAVQVRIEQADGTVTDAGNALPEADGRSWVFTATAANAILPGSRVQVQVFDLPGNMAEAAYLL